MTGDWRVDAADEEPSQEDFEAAELEDVARPIPFRLLRAIVGVLVIFALLLYFVRPFREVFNSAPFRWLRPDVETHPIPLAPQDESGARLCGPTVPQVP